MPYLLNLIYLVLLTAYLPVILFERLFKGKQRPGFWQKISGRVPARQSNRPCAWFHAVSLGEVHALQSIVKEFRQSHLDWEIVISTTTQTGLEGAQRAFPDCQVVPFPFDFTWANHQFLDRVRPDILVLAELEIWPNLIRQCDRRHIPVSLINGRLTEKSFLSYRRFRFLQKSIQLLTVACVQNETYANRFKELGLSADRIVISGNVKMDSLLTDRLHPQIQKFRQWIGIGGDEPQGADAKRDDLILIAGSTQAPEEELIISAYENCRKEHPQLRLLICPRHPERFDEVARLLECRGIEFSRRSTWGSGPQLESPITAKVILLDAMGELRYWWGTADLGFVGGSFGDRGGQNMLEPASLGVATSFGPNTWNFAREVQWLLEHNAAIQFESQDEICEFIRHYAANDQQRMALGTAGVEAIRMLKGDGEESASAITLNELDRVIGQLDVNNEQAGRRVHAAA